MSEGVDTAIIGAGIVGLATAHALTRDGHRSVAIFDRSWPGSGDSGRSFSMVRRHYSNAVTARLAMAGSQTIADWENEVGVADAGYVRCGYLLTVPDRLEAACRDNVARLQRIGLDTHFLEPYEIGQLEPELSTDGVAGAAYEPDGGFTAAGRVVLATGAWTNDLLRPLGAEQPIGLRRRQVVIARRAAGAPRPSAVG